MIPLINNTIYGMAFSAKISIYIALSGSKVHFFEKFKWELQYT